MDDETARYRAALERIANYDAAAKPGYLDEWTEAEAFIEVQAIAAEALNPATQRPASP